MKEWLDQKFADWRGTDRTKTIQGFSVYLGVEYGALEHWMSGRRKPKRENVDRLADKLGQEAYDVAGLARPGNGVEQRVMSKFASSWNKMPPDLQRETEELFETITVEEFAIYLKEIIKRKMGRAVRGASACDENESDEKQPQSRPAKGTRQNKAQLLRRGGGVS